MNGLNEMAAREYNVGSRPGDENDKLIEMVTDRELAARGVAESENANRPITRKVRKLSAVGD